MDQEMRRVTQIDGMRITTCDDRFELVAPANCEIKEQATVIAFRQWLRSHQARFRGLVEVSEVVR